jgi:hypothetical protein
MMGGGFCFTAFLTACSGKPYAHREWRGSVRRPRRGTERVNPFGLMVRRVSDSWPVRLRSLDLEFAAALGTLQSGRASRTTSLLVAARVHFATDYFSSLG